MNRVVFAMLVVLMWPGCDQSLVGDDYRGEPLFQFRGQVVSYMGGLEEEGDLRVSLFWSPEGETRRPVRVHLGRDPIPRIGVAARALTRLARLTRTPVEIWADGAKKPNRVQARFRDSSIPKEPETLIAKAGD